MRQGFPSAHRVSLFWVWGQILNCWDRETEGWVWAGSVPFQCFSLPSTVTPAPEGSIAEARRMHVGYKGCFLVSVFFSSLLSELSNIILEKVGTKRQGYRDSDLTSLSH